MNPVQVENLNGISAKIQTEVFITDKEDVSKLPKENNSKLPN